MIMRKQCNFVALGLALCTLCAAAAFADSHHELNGTWVLLPSKSDFAGQPPLKSATLTVYDRQHNIYISRTFAFQGPQGTSSYTLSLDGGENSTIHDGKIVRSKARWEGNVLKVTTTVDGVPSVERYTLEADGRLLGIVERPDHQTMTLTFVRQQ